MKIWPIYKYTLLSTLSKSEVLEKLDESIEAPKDDLNIFSRMNTSKAYSGFLSENDFKIFRLNRTMFSGKGVIIMGQLEPTPEGTIIKGEIYLDALYSLSITLVICGLLAMTINALIIYINNGNGYAAAFWTKTLMLIIVFLLYSYYLYFNKSYFIKDIRSRLNASTVQYTSK